MVKNNPASTAIMEQLLLLEQDCQDFSEPDCAVIRRFGAVVGSVVESYSELDRAMDRAREYIQQQDQLARSVCSGRVILADRMRVSKGRFSRVWQAPIGGVWGCLLHANTLLPGSRQFVPFATGIACCETIREYGIESSVRWVNDVLVAGRKIAGFLIESYTSRMSGEEYNLIGFGINVNNRNFSSEISDSATSLANCLDREVDLTQFTEKFIARLAWNIGLVYFEEQNFLQEECYSGRDGKHLILEKFLNLSDTLDKKIVYGFDVMTAPQYEAKVIGVDDNCGLIMQFADGSLKTEYSGEVRYL